ncbi:flavin reductase family protein [Thalassospira sp.]|uniref:flavin reductase family protein n=1 Tax=Thalassospira sp. TaxID=1912094 RepID=UPI00273387A3|nr:flavin reductase family protein [Thalassospira sp.]MDP2697842.1 flavin reductase family protein [Thalassospira sp.]
MSFSPREFRDCLGQFATGVAVVTTRATDGSKAGITINSFASVSLEPPLVLFSVDRMAASHAIFIGDSKHFCINVLQQEQRILSERFAAPIDDRWQGLEFEDDGHGIPRLVGNIASFSCARHAVHDGGDHSIIVGRVENITLGQTGDPLLYYGGGYARLS